MSPAINKSRPEVNRASRSAPPLILRAPVVHVVTQRSPSRSPQSFFPRTREIQGLYTTLENTNLASGAHLSLFARTAPNTFKKFYPAWSHNEDVALIANLEPQVIQQLASTTAPFFRFNPPDLRLTTQPSDSVNPFAQIPIGPMASLQKISANDFQSADSSPKELINAILRVGMTVLENQVAFAKLCPSAVVSVYGPKWSDDRDIEHLASHTSFQITAVVTTTAPVLLLTPAAVRRFTFDEDPIPLMASLRRKEA